MVMSQKKVSYVVYSYPSSKQAGIDIDVFLEPLMENMAKHWNERLRMWDQY
jgi:hypothetical protein